MAQAGGNWVCYTCQVTDATLWTMKRVDRFLGATTMGGTVGVLRQTFRSVDAGRNDRFGPIERPDDRTGTTGRVRDDEPPDWSDG